MFDKLKAKLAGVPSLNELIEEVPAHMERQFDPVAGTFHEIVSDRVHIDVHFVEPNSQLGYRIIFTTGMAMRAMPRGPNEPWPQLAELMVLLPNEWPFESDRFESPEVFWPIEFMKMVARMPHDMGFCLHADHSIPFHDPPSPAPGTNFGGWLVVDPTFWPPSKSVVQLKSGLIVKQYVLMPLTMQEMDYKATQPTADAFRQRLVQLQGFNENSMVARLNRPSWV